MSNEIVIELVDVDVSHENAPETILVRGVKWRVAAGEFWVVGGEQASGKTSFLATAAGLNRPASGTLRIFGRELLEASEAEQVDWRKRIGFVYENGGRLLSHLTVAENIALPLQYHLKLDGAQLNARVEELLKWVDLQEYAGIAPSRLNGRVQQRVALARALAVPTEVLFLDNPLSGFGLREVRWWLDLLRELHAKKGSKGAPLTIVAASGDFRGWVNAASHFGVIEQNQFRVIGGREQVLSSQEPAVREFLATAI
jgi:phospholipid/cholesterol/gamma-HCH transport system ATP-binding protein